MLQRLQRITVKDNLGCISQARNNYYPSTELPVSLRVLHNPPATLCKLLGRYRNLAPSSGCPQVGLAPLGAVPCTVAVSSFLSLDWLALSSGGQVVPALFGLSGPTVLSETIHGARWAWGTAQWELGWHCLALGSRERKLFSSFCEKQRACVTERDGEQQCVKK